MSRQPRVLMDRATEGISVRMLWYDRDNRIVIEVDDDTGSFVIPVQKYTNGKPDAAYALDVFNHPYSYELHRATV